MKPLANQPAGGNAGSALQFAFEHPELGVRQPGCSAEA
jgi:hypothetical protein